MPQATQQSRKILDQIIDVLVWVHPAEYSTCQLAERVGFNAGLVGAILARSAWVVQRRRVRIDRNTVITHWQATDAAIKDYARRNRSAVRIDREGRVLVMCGATTKVIRG